MPTANLRTGLQPEARKAKATPAPPAHMEWMSTQGKEVGRIDCVSTPHMTPYARDMQREPCANRAREEAHVAGTFGAGVATEGDGVVVRGIFLVGVLVAVLLAVLLTVLLAVLLAVLLEVVLVICLVVNARS